MGAADCAIVLFVGYMRGVLPPARCGGIGPPFGCRRVLPGRRTGDPLAPTWRTLEAGGLPAVTEVAQQA